MALATARITVELREISLKDKPDAMLAASPKGTVPVLVLPDGCVIDESLDIMHWALDRADPQDWRARDTSDLISVNDGPFKYHLDRAKYPHRYSAAAAVDHYAQAVALLRPLETRLSADPYLLGPHFGLADAALLPFVRQFVAIDRAAFVSEGLPNLLQWLETWQTSDAFADVMVKYPLWAEGNEPCLFP